MLSGAVVKVVEYPALTANVGVDGKYDIAVPYKAKAVTPYLTISGYYPIHLQTFTMAGKDLANVNFQVPTNGIAKYLMKLLNSTPVDPLASIWALKVCGIVSTFSTKNVRNLDYAGFIGYGAHGVAGATAKISPKPSAMKGPVYFNSSVRPDPKQLSSSNDGGVIFTRVPAGTYTLTASHPTAKFASFKATCRPGWVVNANPPWGLYQTK